MALDKQIFIQAWNIIRIPLLIITIFICVYTIGIWTGKAYFYLGNDLLIRTNIVHESLNLYNNQSKLMNFELTTNNKVVCNTFCEYQLTSSKDGLLLNKSTILKPSEKISFSRIFSAPEKGKGQILYEIEYRCNNIRSYICQSSQSTAYQNSLITLNYIQDPLTINYSDYARILLNKYSEDLLIQDLLNQKNNILYQSLSSKIKLNDVASRIILENKLFLQANETYGAQKYNWALEEYIKIIENDENSSKELYDFSISQNITNNLIIKSIKSYDILALKYIIYRDMIKDLIGTIKMSDSTVNLLKISSQTFLNLTSELQDPLHGSYEYLILKEPILEANAKVAQDAMLSEHYGFIKSANMLYNAELDKICLLKGHCENKKNYYFDENFKDNILTKENICRDLRKLNNIFSRTEINYAITYFNLHYSNDTLFDGNKITQDNIQSFLYSDKNLFKYENDSVFQYHMFQVALAPLEESYKKQIANANEKIRAYNAQIVGFNSIYLNISSEDNNSRCHLLSNYINEINETDLNGFYRKENIWQIIFVQCKYKINHDIRAFDNASYESSPMPNMPSPDNFTSENTTIDTSIVSLLYHPVLYNESIKLYNNNCVEENSLLNKNLSEDDAIQRLYNTEIDLASINYSRFQGINQRINTSIIEHATICCVFGECKPCCQGDDCTINLGYPVVFVHGHAFNQGDDPLFSLSIFDDLQSSLTIEGYINAGIVFPTSNYAEIPRNDWGRSGHPVSVKYSYYLNKFDRNGTIINVIQNSENISEYAKRINDGIDLVLFRTGAKKVDIIAHSMGGLVARKYIADYGPQKVDKLIMIATPNNGTIGRTAAACELLGSSKECIDLKQNSAFLTQLNRYQFNETKIRFYNIIGIGCDTDGDQGDGVIHRSSAELEYARNILINGSCSDFLKPLHNEILDISSHPEMLSNIKNILKE